MTNYSDPDEVEWGEHLDRIADDQAEHAPVEFCPTCSHTLAEHTEAGCEAPSRVPVGGRWPRCYCDVTPEADDEPEDAVIEVGNQVVFRENDEFPRTIGVVTRVWTKSPTITIVSDGRTFARLIRSVRVCS